MFGVLWQPGVRSTTASDPTARWTIAHRRSSDSPSKGAGPWPGSLRQPQPSTQLRNSSYEWLRNRGQVSCALDYLHSCPLQVHRTSVPAALTLVQCNYRLLLRSQNVQSPAWTCSRRGMQKESASLLTA